ncbi:helix-turn-helix transcriptional regulator [Phycicoccus sp. CSK15P-2]|uniref:helix-turn-helix transcriptional regulator n=1 Tax=Phycicoccus sp. CSK15P-2 TaxID=2807627 RepID=UPI00194DF12E|nr:helix-turn-helix transcriptional regulator [Phycicoccus sp. CSK15P-2]MBM6403591.1 helix-turn-helix transcriptional regulator [Phycicoccus sp. CSK15P-2]MBM6405056.1 helix-turn-helix transcriptional regulator [Phycicoccus sp. CSK15P-2]
MNTPTARHDDFFHHVARLMLADEPRLTLLGQLPDAPAHIANRVGTTRSSLWNMQLTLPLLAMRDGIHTAAELGLGSVRDVREMVTETSLRTNPLYASVEPLSRVADVSAPLLVVDQTHAFLAGPDGTRHEATIWETTDPGLVAHACQVFLTTWEGSRPITEVTDRPLLPPRRLQVALHLADGATDRDIAHSLRISQRTVSTEIRAVIDWLGARNRAHAVAMLVGADQ